MEFMEHKNIFIKYLDIPKPSTYLKLEEVKKIPNIFQFPDEEHFYSIHECEQKLMVELKQLFPNCSSYIYHCIGDGLPIHRDIDRNIAFNFIINPGGENVETVWYDDDYNEIYRECIEPNRWHQIKVDGLHTVKGITNKRLSITVN